MAPRPGWRYIRIDVNLPEHPRYRCMTAAGRAHLVEVLCYCRRMQNDGRLTPQEWEQLGPQRARAQLEANGWVEHAAGAYHVIGYADYQQTRAEAEAITAARSASGRAGARARWMANANPPDSKRQPQPIANTMANATRRTWQTPHGKNGETIAAEQSIETPLPPAGQARRDHHLSDRILDMIIRTVRDHHGITLTMRDARQISERIHQTAPPALVDTLTYTRTALLTTPLSEYLDQHEQPTLPTGDTWTPPNSPQPSANGQPPSDH